MNSMQQPLPQPPSKDEGPSELRGTLTTAGLLIASSILGRLYFQLILGASNGFSLFIGSALLPVTLVMSLTAWRTIFIPILLVRLAGQALRRQVPAEDEEPTPARAPGRFVLLLVPLVVCLTVGVVLGALTKLPLVATALQLLVMGSTWGVILFIFAGAGFFQYIFEE
jgi:hypothetical protein